MRTCIKCNQEKQATDYYIRKNKSNNNICKKCSVQRWRNDPDSKRNSQLKNRHNITLIQYNQMFTNQSGNCAICNINQIKLKRRLAVDHCHKTGKIRGLLCERCNVSLGNFNDNVETLKNAILYLSKNHS